MSKIRGGFNPRIMNKNYGFSPYEWKIIEEGSLMSVIDCVKCSHALHGGDGDVHDCVACVSNL